MSNGNVYISYVIQKEKSEHSHHAEIISLPAPQVAIYSENTSQKVIDWAKAKQDALPPSEKVVIINYFSISNVQ